MNKRNTVALCTGALLLTAAGGFALQGNVADAPASASLPPLPTAAASCSAKANVQARATAASAAAAAKIARYPYAPDEGLSALALLHEAASCHALAGAPAASVATMARASEWRTRLQRDYLEHYARYQRALAAAQPASALPELDFLLELLAREHDPFTARLRSMQIALEESQFKEEKP